MADEMSPVELLQAAAARLRKIAEGATDGPWWSDQSEQCYRLHGVHAKLPPAWPGGPVQVMNRQILKAPKQGTTMAEYWPSEADDAWMTTMHPGLAEPLATVLERDANLIQIKGWDHPPDVRDALVREYAETFYAASLRVARVLLGVPDA